GREHDSPDHDSVDAAVGGGGRDRGAAAVPDGVECDRGDRDHPADRDREEERDPDDRLCAGGGAEGGEGSAGGDLRSVFVAVPADHDDDDGGVAGGVAAGAGDGGWFGIAAPTGDYDCGGPAGQPTPHPL